MFSTYDAVEMVIDEAVAQFNGRFIVPKAKRTLLKKDCELIDRLVQEFDCESATAEINDETLALTISVNCYDMVLEYGRTHSFFDLIQRTASFNFSVEGDMLKVSFVFTGLWENKD